MDDRNLFRHHPWTRTPETTYVFDTFLALSSGALGDGGGSGVGGL